MNQQTSSLKNFLTFKPPKPSVSWGLGFAFFLLLLIVPAVEIIFFDTAVQSGLLSADSNDTNIATLTAQLILVIVQLSIVLALLRFLSKGNTLKQLRIKKPTTVNLKSLAKVTAVYFLVLLFVVGPLLTFLPESITNQTQDIGLDTTTTANLELVLSGILLLFLVPLVEEIIYRGVLYQALSKSMPVWAAALGSSFLFGLAHFNVVVGIDTFILGMLLCLVYSKTQNLWMAVGLHSIKNSVAFTFLFLAGGS